MDFFPKVILFPERMPFIVLCAEKSKLVTYVITAFYFRAVGWKNKSLIIFLFARERMAHDDDTYCCIEYGCVSYARGLKWESK